MKFITLTLSDFAKLTADAQVIHSKNDRDRIFEFDDGTILKLFYGKNNRRRARHRATRFIRNSQRLLKKGFITLTPISAYDCPEGNSVYVRYNKLPGTSLDKDLKNNRSLLEKAALFIHSLHEKGIYFRDLHPGNILYQEQQFALIDVQNINFHWLKVPQRRRIKNLTTFLLNRSFKLMFNEACHEHFLDAYARCATLNGQKKLQFMKKFQLFAQKRRQLLEW